MREYWQRQWTAIDPRVEPRAFRWDAEGRVVVSVHQVVRDLSGTVLADQIVEYVYEMQDGLVCRMEFRWRSPRKSVNLGQPEELT